MNPVRATAADALEDLLRRSGPLGAVELAARLGCSQPTLSRRLAQLGDRVIRSGRARATRYLLARDIGLAGSRWPLYRIDGAGHAQLLGELRAVQRAAWQFEPGRPLPAFLHGELASGLFPDLPWFLDDQRPQGYLGRAFAQRFAASIGAPPDPRQWLAEHVLLALLQHGHDAPGDLVLGKHALQRALHGILFPEQAVVPDERADAYPRLAVASLAGELAGSSAAGEQPKFTTTIIDDGATGLRPVIVKFSAPIDTPSGRRWADLLVCEHLAGAALREAGLAAAESTIIEAGGRMFLESTRFDRTVQLGRRGFVALAALDAAHFGHGRVDWVAFAEPLQRSGWLSRADARALRCLGLFGQLIGNSDMHLGNVGLHLADTRPLALAPVYDMLPMQFSPASSGEVVPREFQLPLPVPAQLAEWQVAARAALRFWLQAADDERISAAFRAIAAGIAGQLRPAMLRLGA